MAASSLAILVVGHHALDVLGSVTAHLVAAHSGVIGPGLAAHGSWDRLSYSLSQSTICSISGVLGLGHLGQAYAYAISWLDDMSPSGVDVTLQDVQRTAPANHSAPGSSRPARVRTTLGRSVATSNRNCDRESPLELGDGAAPRPASAAQHLRHRFALGELVDQLVEVADLLHEGVVHVLHADPAHHSGDRRRGLSRASAKKSANVVPGSRCCSNADSSNPVSQRITSSSSAFVRPFFSTLVT